jgi:hypothetical protein
MQRIILLLLLAATVLPLVPLAACAPIDWDHQAPPEVNRENQRKFGA